MSIMTGRSAISHGVIGNDPSSSVMAREDTLPPALRDAGYQTAGVGKMRLTPERTRHGFDELIPPADYYRWMDRQGETVLRPMRHGVVQNEMYTTTATVPGVAGVVVDDVATHSDVLEAFATAPRVAAPDRADGQGLVAFARGELATPRPYIVGTTSISYIARTGSPPFPGLTDGKHKYIWYPEGSVEQFFDLEADSLELTDLSADDAYSDIKAGLRNLLAEDLRERAPHWLDDGELPEVDPIGEPDSYTRRQGWPGSTGEHGPTDTRH